MKNPHGVEPTQFMKRKESDDAIYCDPRCGPIFGCCCWYDLFIGDNCNEGRSCSSRNDGTFGYECHPQYKESLFVNTNEPDEENYFKILDYEVYTHN